MTHLLEWLCDLDQIRLGTDQPLMIQWRAPYARWAVFGFAFVTALFVTLTYRRESGNAVRRGSLALLRGATMAVILGVICQPVLVFQRNRVERARVQVLLDASSSMQQTDQYANPRLAETMLKGADLKEPADLEHTTRLDLARRALATDRATALRTLAAANDVFIACFSSTAEPLARITSPADADGTAEALTGVAADGAATNLSTVLSDTLADGESGRLAAVVVISDGRNTETAGVSEALAAARARQVPIYTVPVGSPRPRSDVSVGPVVTDGTVFAGDLLSVRSELCARGLDKQREIAVKLYDESDDSILASTSVTLGGTRECATIELTMEPARPGRLSLRLAAELLEGEDSADNNVARGEVQVLDDRLRVLYVEGYPRYEYRYLKNTLLREESVRVSCLLLSADADFAQEGTDPIRRFPETAEELREFDVIILGDVDPRGDWITEAQAQMVVDFVGLGGGGLAFIAGQRHAPQGFRGTPLEHLLPVRIDAGFLASHSSAITRGFHPRLTPEGKQSSILRFDRRRARSEALFEALPPLYWMARTGGPKPGAEVLLEHPSLQTASGAAPLVVRGRFGAGRTFFQATDGTWRWRRHTGEMVFDTYWVQVIRALVQAKQIGEDRRVVILPDRPTCRYGQRVSVRMKVLDAQVISALGERTELSLRDADGFVVQRIPMDCLAAPGHAVFEGSFVAERVGTFVLQAEDIAPLPGRRPAQAYLRVEHTALEARSPHADHELLRKLAAGSEGEVVPLDRLAAAFARVEDRSLQIPDDVTEPLWDTRLVLVLFMTLLTAEWLLRKKFGMP